MSSQVLRTLYLLLLLLWYQMIKKLCEKILKLLLLGNTVKYTIQSDGDILYKMLFIS